MRSRSSTTPHLPSYFLLITSIQLFHHQSYGHTFPVPNEPAKSEVHQIPSHPAMICSIELPHYLFFVTVLDGFPIEFLILSVCLFCPRLRRSFKLLLSLLRLLPFPYSISSLYLFHALYKVVLQHLHQHLINQLILISLLLQQFYNIRQRI